MDSLHLFSFFNKIFFIMLHLSTFLFLLLSCQNNNIGNKIENSISYEIQELRLDSPKAEKNRQLITKKIDTTHKYLSNVQSKIYNAFIQSMISKNNSSLNDVYSRLNKINTIKKTNIVQYWMAYLQFYNAIYYSENGDKTNSENSSEKGIEIMNNMSNKNSEDYTLLSYLQAFSLQFKGMKAAFYVSKVNENIETALAIDSGNLRANFVFASNDFYTPKKYGGGTKVEYYLKRAISLPIQSIESDILPSWGKEESYEMLIRHYLNNKDYSNAKLWFSNANNEFPESYIINKLAPKLIGK